MKTRCEWLTETMFTPLRFLVQTQLDIKTRRFRPCTGCCLCSHLVRSRYPPLSSQIDDMTTDRTAHRTYSELAKGSKDPNSTNESDWLSRIYCRCRTTTKNAWEYCHRTKFRVFDKRKTVIISCFRGNSVKVRLKYDVFLGSLHV